MNHLFSDDVYFGITLTEDTFAKPAEPMAAAIKRLMARRKRELRTVQRSFPKFTPGMTTHAYVQLYYVGLPGGGPSGFITAPNRRAPVIEGEEVTEESADA